MTDFGLLPSGFNPKRLADCLAEIQQTFRDTFSSNVDLSASEPFGQLVGILADREAALWEVMDQVYQAGIANDASGVGLDQLFVLVNVQRLSAKATVVACVVVGTPGTVIPSGSQVATTDTGTVLASLADYTIPASGTGTLSFVCSNTGPIPVLSGTVAIHSPVTGWTSATNLLDGVLGRDVETDAAMKVRRSSALTSVISASNPGLVSALLRLVDVTEVKEVENASSGLDQDGRSAHSFEMIVRGGESLDILSMIFVTKASGIKAYGSVNGTVVDAHGDAQPVAFSRPTDVPLYITVNLTVDADFPADGITQVRNAILTYGQTVLRMGQAVAPFKIEQGIETPGIVVFDMRLAKYAGPVATVPVPVGSAELASFDSSRLIVRRVN